MMKAKWSWFKRFLALLIINLVILTVLLRGFEYYLSANDPFLKLPFDTHYYERNSASYPNLPAPATGEYTWGHLVKNNRLGFRERDFEAPKPAGVCRIMVLGDSLTWGAGLDVQERYTFVAERLLKDKFPGRVFEVLNFGVSGAPTVIERDILKDYHELVDPDLIVIGFVYNDPQPRSQGYTVEKEAFDKKYGYWLGVVPQGLGRLRLPKTAGITQQALNNLVVNIGLIPPWEVGVQRTYDVESDEWREFRQALQDIRAMSDKMKLPSPIFAVLNNDIFYEQPTAVDDLTETIPIYLRWFHQAEQTAAELGFKTYNHETELIEQLAPGEIKVNELDAHPSAKVNAIYGRKLAEAIAVYLKEEKLCQPDSPQMPQPALVAPLAEKRLMRVLLADNIRFLGYAAGNDDVERNQMLRLTFGWQALADIEADYLVQTYFLDQTGARWAEQLTKPCQGDCPTSQWPPGMVAPPGSSMIYWPVEVERFPLPLERVFKQKHLAYRDAGPETVSIVPLPLTLIPFPGSLIDQHNIALNSNLPAGGYTLMLNLIDPISGAALPAYDEVAQSWLPDDGIVLTEIFIP